MNDSRSLAQDSRCYEQLKVMDDMNDYESREFRPLYAMKSSKVMALNAMNNLGLWMT